MPEGRLVFLCGFTDPGDGLAGDDQEVRGGLGIDVPECDTVFVFVLHLAGDVTVHYFLEEGLFHEDLASLYLVLGFALPRFRSWWGCSRRGRGCSRSL